jgi:prepilin-type N-terminal cleavage/methylation domain-containing protein
VLTALRRVPHHEAGFTLVELLVVVTLLAVVGSIVTAGVVQALSTARRGQARVYALTDLEVGAHRIGRDLRAADPILVAQPDTLSLTVYRNGGRYRYDYVVAGGTMTETRTFYSTPTTSTVASTTSKPLIAALDTSAGPTFTYTRTDGQPWVAGTDALDDIGQVEVVLARALPEQDPIRVETGIFLRNSVN